MKRASTRASLGVAGRSSFSPAPSLKELHEISTKQGKRKTVKYLDGIADDVITGVNIPTGIPQLYTLDDELNVIESRYLGDAEAAEAAAKAVADQAKSK